MTPARQPPPPNDPPPVEAGQTILDLTEEGFESLYARLETVSQQLEAGRLSLEQSLALYEEGMRLAQQCQTLLGAVEQRIETLRNAGSPGAGGL